MFSLSDFKEGNDNFSKVEITQISEFINEANKIYILEKKQFYIFLI